MSRVPERANFQNDAGVTLAARIDRPAGPIRAWALMAHCFSCSKDLAGAREIARSLTAQGLAVMRFDFTGLGHSEGEFSETNFTSNIADLVAAYHYLARDHAAPTLLIGHSLGGAAAVMAAGSMPNVKAVVTIGAPCSAEHVTHNFAEHVETIEREGRAEVSLAGRPFTITKQFLEDIAGSSVEEAAAGLRRALLVCHSPVDDTVSIDNATRIFVAAKHPKSFLSLDGLDHLLTDKAGAAYVGGAIAGWAARYLPALDAADAPNLAGPNVVRVEETGQGKFQNAVITGDGHRLVADEPAGMGGGGTGPNPYEFLNIALGACTSMTLRLYAEHKGWPVDRIGVTLTQEKTHADDCIRCETDDKAKVDVITRVLNIEGDLTTDQRARLAQIADKCPVHRTLHGPLVVRTTVAED